jgi:alcohol dehydrogenase class IV
LFLLGGTSSGDRTALTADRPPFIREGMARPNVRGDVAPGEIRPFAYRMLPGRIVFAAGSVASLPREVADLGAERTVVIAGRSAEPVSRSVAEGLGSKAVGRIGEVRQHVPAELASSATATAVDLDADLLLAIGGGSSIGLAKAVALETGIPVLAVPTTYSGSEMTPVYGITDRVKRTGSDDRVLPRIVVYDPALTLDLSARVTAASGFNALAHCVEALYAPGANPVTSLLAEEGLRTLADALPSCVTAPRALGGRSAALYGAHLAGTALAVAGIGLEHRLSHILGGDHGLVHADVHAVLLPHVAAFNTPAAPDAMAVVARALGAGDDPAAAGPALHRLAVRIGAPTSLAELGMPAGGLDAAAERAAHEALAGNPRTATEADLRRLLQDAFEGRPPGPECADRSA